MRITCHWGGKYQVRVAPDVIVGRFRQIFQFLKYVWCFYYLERLVSLFTLSIYKVENVGIRGGELCDFYDIQHDQQIFINNIECPLTSFLSVRVFLD